MATYKDDLDIIKAAEKDSSKLSLNAITELDNKGLLGMYGGGSGKAIPDEFGLMIFVHSGEVPVPEWGVEDKTYYLAEYITKDFNYVSSKNSTDIMLIEAIENSDKTVASVEQIRIYEDVDGAYKIASGFQDSSLIIFLPSGEVYFVAGGK